MPNTLAKQDLFSVLYYGTLQALSATASESYLIAHSNKVISCVLCPTCARSGQLNGCLLCSACYAFQITRTFTNVCASFAAGVQKFAGALMRAALS